MCDRCPNNFLKAVTYYHIGILKFTPTFQRNTIYNQPPSESGNEKLQKILKLWFIIFITPSTSCMNCFTHFYTKLSTSQYISKVT